MVDCTPWHCLVPCSCTHSSWQPHGRGIAQRSTSCTSIHVLLGQARKGSKRSSDASSPELWLLTVC